MSTTSKPTLPGGFRDYIGADTARRHAVMDAAERTFRLFGFSRLDTPAVEYTALITGGEESFDKQLLTVDDGELALRPEHTLPLARVMAAHPQEFKKPAKLYSIGPIWRGERQQAGRYKEFMQADADIIGAKRIVADAEILALAVTVLREIGVADAVVRINHRGLVNALLKHLKIVKEERIQALRALDKYERIGWEGVQRELKNIGIGGDKTRVIKSFVSVSGRPGSVLQKLRELLRDSKEAQDVLDELTELTAYLDTFKVPGRAWRIAPSVVRGLGYYTGMVFEIWLKDREDIGAVGAGGRYDELMERVGGKALPTVGMSLGVDRLLTALGNAPLEMRETGAVVVLADEERDGIAVTQELRGKGVPAALYFGKEKTLKGRLAYAASVGAPVVVIIGKKEKESGTVTVKDMRARKQETVERGKAAGRVRDMI